LKAVGASLSLAANAIKGLQRIGVAEEVIFSGHQLRRFVVPDSKGKSISEADSEALSQKTKALMA